jgi:hypothetical protein
MVVARVKRRSLALIPMVIWEQISGWVGSLDLHTYLYIAQLYTTTL